MASSQIGMGSMPIPSGGVGFRLWAPFAKQVFVAGEFNHWSRSANPLDPEGNGNWSADVPLAKEGQQYRYLIQTKNDEELWRTDPRARRVSDDDNGYIVQPKFFWDSGQFEMPGFNELVIYEVHVATFNSAGATGTFDSLISRLDDLKDLGVNAIELLPIFGFPGEHSLGYNPAFPFDIESHYGSDEGFRDFIRSAHKKGMAVIMDVVFNHFGPGDLDVSLRRIDGWFEDGGDGIYFYNDWRRDSGFGPRPDFGRSEVCDYIRDNLMLWINEYHVDGFRFDSTINIRNAYGHNNDSGTDIPEGWYLMQRLNYEVKNHQPSAKITIAEDLQNNEWITKASNFQGGAGFDAQWGSQFYWTIREAMIAPLDSTRNLWKVRDVIEQKYGSDAFSRILYSENHDEARHGRLPEEIYPAHADSYAARKRSILAAAIVLTTPGIPMLFQGQEFLEWGTWSDTTPLDWNKKSSLLGGKIFNLYRDLVHLRRNWHNNTRGLTGQYVQVYHVNNGDKVLAYHRWRDGGSGDDVVIVANFSNQSFPSYSIGFPQGGVWWVRLNSDSDTYSPDFGNFGGYTTNAFASDAGDPDFMPYRGNVGIAPYSVLILSQ